MEPGVLSLLLHNIHQEDWMALAKMHGWYLQIAMVIISILPLSIATVCIVWLWKNKMQATRLALAKTTRDKIVKRRINMNTENQLENHQIMCFTKTDESANENRYSYIPYYLKDMYVERRIIRYCHP